MQGFRSPYGLQRFVFMQSSTDMSLRVPAGQTQIQQAGLLLACAQ